MSQSETPCGAPRPSLILYASQIAAAIGCNRHKKPSDALEMMWERLAPESYYAALRRNSVESEAEKINKIITTDERARVVMETSMLSCETSSDVASQYDTVAKKINALDFLDEEDRKLFDATVKRNLFTNYGTASEHHALVKVRETLGINAHPDAAFYKEKLGDVNGVEVWIGGKIDAITEDRSLVIEIKNRIRRLFYKVPFYEIVQVQCYLQLLNVSRGAIVECLTTAPDNSTINIVPVRRDRDLWTETVVPKALAFAATFVDIINNADFQDDYLKSTKRSLVVQTRMHKYLVAKPWSL